MFVFGLKDMTYKYELGHVGFTAGNLADCSSMELVSARRAFAAVQAGLWSDAPFLATRTGNPAFYKGGPRPVIRAKVEFAGWPGAEVETSWVGLIGDDDGQLKSDVLLSQEVVEVEAHTAQFLWIEIPVPADAQPGTYQGQVRFYVHTMFEDEKEVGVCPFSLRVHEYVLPDSADYRFYLDLWQHNSNIARKYEVELWSDEHFATLQPYVASLANLGQKAISVMVSEIPWSGQGSYKDRDYTSDLFEYSCVRVTKRADGSFFYDFSALDRYIEMCIAHGIDQEIEVFGLIGIWQYPDAGYVEVSDFGDGVRVRYLDSVTQTYRYMQNTKEIAGYIQALEQHFVERGWIDIVRVVADEPGDIELHQRRLDKLHKIAPRFHFKTAINHVEMIEKRLENMDDYVPALQLVSQHWEGLAELRAKVPGRLYWYVCCSPAFPNTFIRSPLAESQLIPALTKYMGLDGFLRWNYTVWPDEPRKRISFRSPFWCAGDTNFVYPGSKGPLLTLRYKNLLRGIQTFEALCRAEELPKGAEVVAAYFERILKEKDLSEYHPYRRRKPEELYELDGAIYQQALSELLSALGEN